MANFDDIANNQHMIDIANAIRAVTRTTGKMTIPEMPERLWNIQVVMTRDVICDFSGTSPVSLGIYDKGIKHLFIATPKTSADVALLAKVEAELELSYDETTGELEVSFSKPLEDANAVNIKVVDLLLASTATSSGFLVNQAVGGGSKTEEYDNSKEYEVGDTFIYGGSLGVTVVAHEAEEFSNIHNKLMANQVFDTDNQVYRDLQYYAELVLQKLDASAVKNEHSDSQEEVYSADYMNKSFAPLAFAIPLYAHRVNNSDATLERNAPVAGPGNTMFKISTNIDYDWSSPDFTFVRTLDTGITVSRNNSITMTLPFIVNRDSNISWGARVKVSQDNGQTWNYISSEQAYGATTFEAAAGNTFIFTVTFDLLTDIATYEAGTLLAIEVYKKQALPAELTTTVQCGVERDGAIINTMAQFVVANVAIDTAQIKDGSVTYAKLATPIQQKIDAIDNKLDKVNTTSTLKKVYTKNTDGTQSMTDIENEVNEGSDKLITSGAVYTALSDIQIQPASKTVLGGVYLWTDSNNKVHLSTTPAALDTPNISLSGSILSIQNVEGAESYDIYVDGVFTTNIQRSDEE